MKPFSTLLCDEIKIETNDLNICLSEWFNNDKRNCISFNNDHLFFYIPNLEESYKMINYDHIKNIQYMVRGGYNNEFK